MFDRIPNTLLTQIRKRNHKLGLEILSKIICDKNFFIQSISKGESHSFIYVIKESVKRSHEDRKK